ncbi:putative cytochrome b5 [Blattamonas nauphoetae]|uniref:Cytochrome b5 domain-containing protein 1 n=1 Tax=Blattamonas nauphoetae TaxID=2049346 RepID=A0ABQ9YA00_9EUKA|nr:putative cytochrome b5 [Blattamonas nauphoetae]
MTTAEEAFHLPDYESDASVADLPRYFHANDVAQHNSTNDCWVSFLGKVYNITPLLEEYKNDTQVVNAFLNAAGRDISHWFNPKTGEFRTHDDSQTGLSVPFTPMGPVLHVLPHAPRTDIDTTFEVPWYKDPKYQIGTLTKKSRKIRIKNVLVDNDEYVLEVCTEEPLSQIRARYMSHNAHAHSYTWKFLRRVLDMNKTLEENNIPDEDEEFARLNMNRDEFMPTIFIYFNDDLTEA